MPKQPKSLIIVGGGYIAMEFAHVFDGLGTKVTVVMETYFPKRRERCE